MNKITQCVQSFRDLVYSVLDIPSGVALGLLTLSVVYSIFKGHDVGMGSAAAYATAVGAFAATNIKKAQS